MVLVVDVVGRFLGGAVPGEVEQVGRGREDLGLREHVQVRVRTLQHVAEQFDVLGNFVAQFAVELVTAHA